MIDTFDVGVMGWVNTPGFAVDVTVDGAHAYVADEWMGLQVVDISNPFSISIVNTVSLLSSIHSVAVSGSYCYVTDGSCEGDDCFVGPLGVFDISSVAASPATIGSVDTPSLAQGVEVAGSYAFIASGEGGLQVADISDPKSPQLVGNIITSGNAVDVVISGSHAFVSYNGGSGGGLKIFDISSPAQPTLIGAVRSPRGWSWGLAVAGSFVYLADGLSGLQVISRTWHSQ